jgi:hydrogenase-4 component F
MHASLPHAAVTMSTVALLAPLASGLLAAAAPRRLPYVAGALVGLLGLAAAGLAVATGRWTLEYGALALVLAAFAFGLSPSYLGGRSAHHSWPPARQRAYYALLGAFTATLVALGEPWPLLALWLAVEATTVSSVALVALTPGARPFEAAWKYLVLAGFAGLLALGGLVLLGGAGPRTVSIGTVLVLVGLGAKAGLAPFHQWLPDAHAEAPAPVSALLSGAELAGVLVVLRRALLFATARLGGAAWPLDALLAMAIVSLAVAVALIPLQQNLKRLFAYSSIEHMGVVAAGFAFGGLGTVGAFLHIFTHGLAKAEAFYLAGGVQARYRTVQLRRIGRLHRTMPWTAAGLLTATAALAGVPPFGPFWSEWLVITGGIAAPHRWPFAVAVAVLLAIGFFGLAYRLPGLWHRRPPAVVGRRTPEPRAFALTAVLLSVLTAGAGLLVPWLYHGR